MCCGNELFGKKLFLPPTATKEWRDHKTYWMWHFLPSIVYPGNKKTNVCAPRISDGAEIRSRWSLWGKKTFGGRFEGKYTITSLTSTPDFETPHLFFAVGRYKDGAQICISLTLFFFFFSSVHICMMQMWTELNLQKSCETRLVCCWAVANGVWASLLQTYMCTHLSVYCYSLCRFLAKRLLLFNQHFGLWPHACETNQCSV